MDTTPLETLPALVQTAAERATEIFISFRESIRDSLIETFRAVVPPRTPLEFLCPAETTAPVILALLQARYLVYEAPVQTAPQIFFDRRRGFNISDWSSLTDPYGTACDLAWSRTGAFLRLHGTVQAVEDNATFDYYLIQLTEHPRQRLTVPRDQAQLRPGQTVTLLGRYDFHLGSDTPRQLECVAVFQGTQGDLV